MSAARRENILLRAKKNISESVPLWRNDRRPAAGQAGQEQALILIATPQIDSEWTLASYPHLGSREGVTTWRQLQIVFLVTSPTTFPLDPTCIYVSCRSYVIGRPGKVAPHKIYLSDLLIGSGKNGKYLRLISAVQT